MIRFHNFSCEVTILRSDGSQYDSSNTITLTEKKVEELCPSLPSTTTPPPTTAPTSAPAQGEEEGMTESVLH